MTRFVLALATALLIAGCSNPWADDRPTRADIFSAGWVNDDLPVTAQTERADRAIYCYRTLASEDCYAQPIAGAATRLRGYVGPAPHDIPAP